MMNQAELAHYNELYAQIGEEIQKTGEEITRKKEELAAARQVTISCTFDE